ncbi:hypothetical protein M9H77_35650 [Catharanthus roseus]|uniref:Uncharacterized protein n=1 Tax=Catharanthus roseus TaxID=4058 RepID=A0ACB9ZT93_CATRO|nr:hypothetical protein M9H77_35650 [Catharanthus roseus]
MTGECYPNLVREFYSNMFFKYDPYKLTSPLLHLTERVIELPLLLSHIFHHFHVDFSSELRKTTSDSDVITKNTIEQSYYWWDNKEMRWSPVIDRNKNQNSFYLSNERRGVVRGRGKREYGEEEREGRRERGGRERRKRKRGEKTYLIFASAGSRNGRGGVGSRATELVPRTNVQILATVVWDFNLSNVGGGSLCTPVPGLQSVRPLRHHNLHSPPGRRPVWWGPCGLGISPFGTKEMTIDISLIICLYPCPEVYLVTTHPLRNSYKLLLLTKNFLILHFGLRTVESVRWGCLLLKIVDQMRVDTFVLDSLELKKDEQLGLN